MTADWKTKQVCQKKEHRRIQAQITIKYIVCDAEKQNWKKKDVY